jgi:hypothetical protein
MKGILLLHRQWRPHGFALRRLETQLQDHQGNLFTGTEESINVPLVTNLRQDPWERYRDQSMLYGRWWGDKLWTMIPAVTLVGGFLQTFKEYPPSQVSGSLSIEKALQTIERGVSGGGK